MVQNQISKYFNAAADVFLDSPPREMSQWHFMFYASLYSFKPGEHLCSLLKWDKISRPRHLIPI